MAANLLFRMMLAVVLVGVGACGNPFDLEVGNVAGTYTLRTIIGLPLPVSLRLSVDPSSGTLFENKIVSADLTLRRDGTFSLGAVYSETVMTTNGQVIDIQMDNEEVIGKWKLVNGTMSFTDIVLGDVANAVQSRTIAFIDLVHNGLLMTAVLTYGTGQFEESSITITAEGDGGTWISVFQK